ncbi:MAG: hypothetical protein KA954_01235 [Chitinophagales bacterium]|nr:hypothetical protein [Chitinophagales bacterium]MBP9845844.1 hypothetical protein [Saprospiraceae bacterium]
MNKQQKAALVVKYKPMQVDGKTIEEVLEAIKADEATPTEKEADEIANLIFTADNTEQPSTLNKKYEEWKVKPVYEDIKDGMGAVIGRKLKSFEKDAQKAIRTTSITEDKAAILNSQSENTLVRLFEVK